MPLKLEVGKRYVTRGGRVTAPMQLTGSNEPDSYPFNDGTSDTWTQKGTIFFSGEDDDDCMSEFVPELQRILGIPDGYRVVRFGQVSLGELFLGADDGQPYEFLKSASGLDDRPFFALVVEKIQT